MTKSDRTRWKCDLCGVCCETATGYDLPNGWVALSAHDTEGFLVTIHVCDPGVHKTRELDEILRNYINKEE